MSQETSRINLLYSELSYSERKEVRVFIEEFEKEDFDRRTSIKESLNKAFTSGPLSGGTCPRCGK